MCGYGWNECPAPYPFPRRHEGGPVVARVVVVSNRVGVPNRDGGAKAGDLK